MKPIRDESGKVVRFFGTNTDVTELRELQEALKEADRRKDEFLAIVSHELRTPLTSMLGWSRLLLDSSLDAAKAAHGLRVIERNVRLQTQLIEDLLDLSRVITGKLALTITAVDITQVISAAIESVSAAAEAKQIKIERSIASALPIIAGDAGRLQQVAWNLLSNAIKFTPRGGRVAIAAKYAASSLHVIVEDSGKGIAPAFLPYVFERFRQADSTTTRSDGGLGLGLAIVRYLVEQHGGHVRAESAGEGKGATFIVELPIRAIAKTPAKDSGFNDGVPAGKGKHLQGVRVLVVEDDADSRDLVMVVLESAGATVIGATSARQAFREIDRCVPDLLVCDIGMPGKDGFEFIRELRTRDAIHGGAIPALALTAFAREEDRILAMEARGFHSPAPQPLEPNELIARVLRLLAAHAKVSVLGGSQA